MIGQSLGHYRIVERLGAGGMGEVHRARDEKLGRDVALKVLPAGALADEDARRRFRKEAAVLSRLTHPHVASLLDADSADGTDFLVMELVAGATLEEELRKGPLAERDVVRLGAQLARGLMAAHEQGVVHRDLKPSNLALTSDGLLKVLDFGVAHLEPDARAKPGDETTTHTGRGAVVGSPPYMSPEQLLGREVDARTDLYSAGAVLYELVTGKRPFGSKTGVELHDAVLHEAPPPPREVNGAVTPGLEAVILKALDKDKALRYQSARELLVDLERLQATTAASARTSASHHGRRRVFWKGLAAALALAAVAAAWAIRPSPELRISGAYPVTHGVPPETQARWASDGSSLYYYHWVAEDSRNRYYQVPIAGGAPTEIPIPLRLGNIWGYLPRHGALLVNGTASLPVHGSLGLPLWLASVPSGSVRRIGDLAAWQAVASPDEQQLALVYGAEGENRIAVARADGTGLREILKVGRAGGLAWAPDGKHLRFSAQGPPGHELETWLWETSVRGEPARPLWPGEAGQWSLDGRHFVFQRRFDNRDWQTDLWAIAEAPFLHWPRSEPFRLSFGPLSFSSPGVGPDGRLFAWGVPTRASVACPPTAAARRSSRGPSGAHAFWTRVGGPTATRSSTPSFRHTQAFTCWTFAPRECRWSPEAKSS